MSSYGVDRHLLPSKGVFGFFSRPKKGELTETQGMLEGMLMAVVQNCPVAPAELFKFLQYPFSVSIKSMCTLKTTMSSFFFLVIRRSGYSPV